MGTCKNARQYENDSCPLALKEELVVGNEGREGNSVLRGRQFLEQESDLEMPSRKFPKESATELQGAMS